jgi:hypothetical protein
MQHEDKNIALHLESNTPIISRGREACKPGRPLRKQDTIDKCGSM